jgi:lipopolysaccharide transport system ATP-binding protein
MQLRLAFAVAAFLEPEILVIDEVLAVGDAEFQKKCLGKMESVSKSGRTILFVSHNMSFIEAMCPRTILLASGKVKADGDTQEVISNYLADTQSPQSQNSVITLDGGVTVTSFTLPAESIRSFDNLGFSFTIESPEANKVSELALLVYNDREERVAIADLRHQQLWDRSASSLQLTIEGMINEISYIPGRYSLGIYISSNLCKGDFYNLRTFEVESAPATDLIPFDKKYRGYVDVKATFKIK